MPDSQQSYEEDLKPYTLDARGNPPSFATVVALLGSDISYIKRDVKDIKEKLSKDYITREEFEPVKRLVYGLVGTILLSTLGAILALVYKSHA